MPFIMPNDGKTFEDQRARTGWGGSTWHQMRNQTDQELGRSVSASVNEEFYSGIHLDTGLCETHQGRNY